MSFFPADRWMFACSCISGLRRSLQWHARYGKILGPLPATAVGTMRTTTAAPSVAAYRSAPQVLTCGRLTQAQPRTLRFRLPVMHSNRISRCLPLRARTMRHASMVLTMKHLRLLLRQQPLQCGHRNAAGSYFLIISDSTGLGAQCGAYNLTLTGTLPVKLQGFSVQ